MSTTVQDDLQQIWERVRSWPQPMRISLASKIVQSLEAEQGQPTDNGTQRTLEERHPPREPRIVNRGDGPKIEGTRITVYTVLEYVKHGRSRDWIAAFLRLSSAQVQAAMDYIRDNEEAVNSEYEKIMARIAKGNPPEILAKLAASHEKMKARLAELRARKEHAAG